MDARNIIVIVFVLYIGCEATDQQLTGGFIEPASIDDPLVQFVAHWTARQLSGHLLTILSAKKQLVQGFMYYMKLEITKDHQIETCKVKVWNRIWLHSTKIVYLKCHPEI